MAKSFAAVLTQPLLEFDMRVVAAQSTQAELVKEMDKLASELQLFLASAAPPEVEPVISRLNVARRRLLQVNATLKTVLDRIDRVQTFVQSRTFK
ncbi:hypothetical protein HDU97_003616 [Phlyctochytrium planicorne]|nr:hypothetical protein HDU97_003616 [Phlyctochytrium planicorne]